MHYHKGGSGNCQELYYHPVDQSPSHVTCLSNYRLHAIYLKSSWHRNMQCFCYIIAIICISAFFAYISHCLCWPHICPSCDKWLPWCIVMTLWYIEIMYHAMLGRKCNAEYNTWGHAWGFHSSSLITLPFVTLTWNYGIRSTLHKGYHCIHLDDVLL